MGEWRAGGKLKRTLYKHDQLVGLVDTPELAAEIVETMNRVGQLLADVELLRNPPPGVVEWIDAYVLGDQQPADAQRRSEATPKKDLVVCEACGAEVPLDGPLHEGGRLMPHKVAHETRPERWCHASRQVPLSMALGASRVDPYDTTKGGVTDG